MARSRSNSASSGSSDCSNAEEYDKKKEKKDRKEREKREKKEHRQHDKEEKRHEKEERKEEDIGKKKEEYLRLGDIEGQEFGETGSGGEEDSESEGEPEDEDLKTLFWLYMLERGFWVQHRGHIALILDIPQEVLDRFVVAVGDFVKQHEPLLKL